MIADLRHFHVHGHWAATTVWWNGVKRVGGGWKWWRDGWIQRNMRKSVCSSLHLVTCMVRTAHGSFYRGFLLFVSLIQPPHLAPRDWLYCKLCGWKFYQHCWVVLFHLYPPLKVLFKRLLFGSCTPRAFREQRGSGRWSRWIVSIR